MTNLGRNIPAYFVGNWVKITSGGVVKGPWRIASVVPNSTTMFLSPKDTETISLVEGDSWQGVYLFDSKTVTGSATLVSTDPITIGAAVAPAPVALDVPPASPAPGGTVAGGSAMPGSRGATIDLPAVLASIELPQTVVSSPATVGGAVFLTAPAPPGGAVVTLSSSTALLQVPATVVVREGAMSAPFKATVACGAGEQTVVTLSAVCGATQVATITITDCPPAPAEKRPGAP